MKQVGPDMEAGSLFSGDKMAFGAVVESEVQVKQFRDPDSRQYVVGPVDVGFHRISLLSTRSGTPS